MNEASRPTNYEYNLDVVGRHTPTPYIYTQICLCFPLSAPANHNVILDTLNTGLRRLSKNFPWTAGQVVREARGEDGLEICKIVTLDEPFEVVVQDVSTNATMSMGNLRRSHYPISLLDEDMLCPVRTQPQDLKHWPVLVTQATFVDQGVLLSFTLHHGVGDMTALAQIMHLLNKACREDEFTEEELRIGNLERDDVIPVFDETWHPNDEHDMNDIQPPRPPEQVRRGDKTTATAHPHPPNLTWANFAFSAEGLDRLKSRAMKTVPPESYVSTDDALTAFIWQRMVHARLPRLSHDSLTACGRTIDMRHYLNLPLTYAGHVATKTSLSLDTYTLIEKQTLGVTAAQLRAVIDPKISGITYDYKADTTLTKRTGRRPQGIRQDLSKDIMLSSWAKYTDIWSFDFSLGLGPPDSVRRPLFRPSKESLVYLLPKKPNGEIVAAICMRDEDMIRLRMDEAMADYAQYIG